MVRGFVAAVAVIVAATAAFWPATEGFRVFTTEGARRLEVARSPRSLPAVVLEDQDGRRVGPEWLRGRVVLVEFVYTRCPTVCSTLGETFGRLSRALPGVALLSVTFDIEHDGRAELKDYAIRHGADGDRWRVVRPTGGGDLRELLDTAGVVVIPDPWGGYQHNAAIHLVDGRGRLVRILDFEPLSALIDEVTPWLAS